jgi:hypothetical protein
MRRIGIKVYNASIEGWALLGWETILILGKKCSDHVPKVDDSTTNTKRWSHSIEDSLTV